MGSTEKHGAHCPLGTDSFTAMGVIEKAAELSDTLYTPLLPVGYSPHHMGRVGQGTVLLHSQEIHTDLLFMILQ